MHGRRVFVVIALILLSVSLQAPRQPRAAGVKAGLSPASVASSGPDRARILAGHGEWVLAWDAMDAGDGGSDDLAVAVLTRLGRYAAAESVLARELLFDTKPTGSFFLHLQRARLLVESGDAVRALESLAPIESIDDAMYSAYRDVVLARARLANGDAAGAESALDRALAAGPPAALRSTIDEARADAAVAAGDLGRALAITNDAVGNARDAATRSHLLRRTYDLAVESGDGTAAARAAQRLCDEHRRSQDARACAIDFVSGGMAPKASSGVLLSCATAFQAQGCAPELRRTLRLLEGRELKPRDGESRRLFWGEYHYMNADYARAIALARPTYSDDSLRRRSTILLARSFRRLGRNADAAVVYESFARVFPNDALAAEALSTAATLYAEAGKADESSRARDELRRAYPSTFYGWAAAIECANELERRGQEEDAVAIYEQWLTRSKRTDEAALYYLSRVHADDAEDGRRGMLLDELSIVNPYSFYVRPDVAATARVPKVTGEGATRKRAALSDWLTATESRRESAYRRVLAAADAQTQARDVDEVRFARARLRRFLEAGFDDWAERELEAVLRESVDGPVEMLRLARLFDENAMPWRSVRLYERVRAGMSWEDRRAHVDDFRYLTFPIPYPAQVFEAAVDNDVAPHLLYALIREESRFEAEAVSRAGAVGLMQLMPATASRVAAQMDLAWGGIDELDNPGVNVAIGAWYAADLLRDGRGSVAWMLAAYNAGPGAARQWIEPGTVGDAAVDAVEMIGYRETRGYVKRVVESANIYHDLYFDATAR